jgi:GTP diphosphokinase / guanosine-3',5'-bis(diphosphate) 3'-diphosphatase
MSTLERAIEIAARAHAGQVDKGGQPYILHPIRVMLSVKSESERIAAVLHDVVEDSEITLDDLRSEGFSDEIVEAVDVLTEREGETKMDKAVRASKNSIAKAVKLADLADNMNQSRISQLTEKDRNRLQEYEAARDFLLSHNGRSADGS